MAEQSAPIPIDPALALMPDGEIQGTGTPATAPAVSTALTPAVDAQGRVLTTRDEYATILNSVKTRQPLRVALSQARNAPKSVPKSWSLDKLRQELTQRWYPPEELHSEASSSHPARPTGDGEQAINAATSLGGLDEDQHRIIVQDDSELPIVIARRSPPSSSTSSPSTSRRRTSTDDEADLVNEFGGNIGHATTPHLLSLPDNGDDDDDDSDDIDDGSNANSGQRPADESAYEAYQKQLRVEAVLRAEGNRRDGGRRTQQAMVRGWNEFVADAMPRSAIKDNIVDEHSMLLFIKYHAERPKRTRHGVPIPGTFVGAVRLLRLLLPPICDLSPSCFYQPRRSELDDHHLSI